MPKKKNKNKKPMKTMPQRFPKVGIAMTLEQIYGFDPKKNETLAEEIYTTIFEEDGMNREQRYADVEAMCNNVYPGNKVNADIATQAIFKALKK